MLGGSLHNVKMPDPSRSYGKGLCVTVSLLEYLWVCAALRRDPGLISPTAACSRQERGEDEPGRVGIAGQRLGELRGFAVACAAPPGVRPRQRAQDRIHGVVRVGRDLKYNININTI